MKEATSIPTVLRSSISGLCVLLLLLFPGGAILFAQDAAEPQQQGAPPPQAQLLSPDQLNNLVAPIALYPDNLLSQLLVASTYPLEVVEAAQWLQQNRGLAGSQLVDAARQQNWDASIQALVVFPDVLNRLASDVQWTTALGNAFLAQQADVMSAVQRLRSEARASGKLNSTPQQNVTTQTQDGQTAIDIQPTNPQVVYVPVYNPEYIWGPPVYGYYPPLFYPGFAFGFGFGPGIFLGGFFGGLGWGGWGWGPNWFGGLIFTNAFFFNHYGFHGGFGPGFRGGVWAHNPAHRLGVPYSNRAVASRFGGNFNARGGLGRAGAEHAGFANAARGNAAGGARSFAQSGNRGTSGNWQHFGQSGAGARSAQPSARSGQSFSGNSNAFRGNASPARNAPAFRSSPSAGNAFHSAPSNGGGFAARGNAGGNSFHGNAGGSSFHGGGSSGGGFHGGGGGAPHASGGGGSHASGGGGSHASAGGGSHGGGGGSHGGGGHR